MKRVVAVYFALLVVGNYWLARILGEFSGAALVTCEEAGVKYLPAISDLILPLGGWPAWVLLAVAAVGLVLSLVPRVSRGALLHFVVLLLCAECLFLFATTVAYSIPFIDYHPPSCAGHHSRRSVGRAVAESDSNVETNTVVKADLSQLGEVVIPEIEFEDVSVQDALAHLREKWKEHTGAELPMAEVISQYEFEDPDDRLITFSARHLPFLEALRIVADLSGYRLQFKDHGVILTDIWPGESMSFQCQLNDQLKTALGLAEVPDSGDIREALSSRGVDFSKGDMQVFYMRELDKVVISGFTENAEVAKAVLRLVLTGYEVKKNTEEPE